MEVRSINQSPNFGMAMVKTKQAEKYVNRLPYDKAMEIIVMEMDSKRNPLDFYVSTIVKNGKEKIKVEAGHKTFVEGFLSGPVKTIRKGFDFINKLNEEQQAQNALTKGMARPTLG
ncbi:MAG: hypothetical protein K6E29_08685 [Cyanobacteria bacterium RUI128]|nr:hypothetical protein [Cyanobacteria bacterium RUI128]